MQKKIKQTDRQAIEKLSSINGQQLIYLLKNLGITHAQYSRKVDPPFQSSSGVGNYRHYASIPYRLVKPLINEYDPYFLLALLRKKWVID